MLQPVASWGDRKPHAGIRTLQGARTVKTTGEARSHGSGKLARGGTCVPHIALRSAWGPNPCYGSKIHRVTRADTAHNMMRASREPANAPRPRPLFSSAERSGEDQELSRAWSSSGSSTRCGRGRAGAGIAAAAATDRRAGDRRGPGIFPHLVRQLAEAALRARARRLGLRLRAGMGHGGIGDVGHEFDSIGNDVDGPCATAARLGFRARPRRAGPMRRSEGSCATGGSAARRRAGIALGVGGDDAVLLDRGRAARSALAVGREIEGVAGDAPGSNEAVAGEEGAVGAQLHHRLAVAGVGPAADQARIDHALAGGGRDRMGSLPPPGPLAGQAGERTARVRPALDGAAADALPLVLAAALPRPRPCRPAAGRSRPARTRRRGEGRSLGSSHLGCFGSLRSPAGWAQHRSTRLGEHLRRLRPAWRRSIPRP